MFFIGVVWEESLLFVYLHFNWPRERRDTLFNSNEYMFCFSIRSCISVQHCSCRPIAWGWVSGGRENNSVNKCYIQLTSIITLHATVILSDKKVGFGFFLMLMYFRQHNITNMSKCSMWKMQNQSEFMSNNHLILHLLNLALLL